MNGQTIRVFGMHLDLSGLWRRRQAAAIIAYAGQQEVMPTVLMGDLNDWSAQGGCLRDFAHHFHFSDCATSFHALRPVARLHRIIHFAKLYSHNRAVHYIPSSLK